jgi:hypothetical protein
MPAKPKSKPVPAALRARPPVVAAAPVAPVAPVAPPVNAAAVQSAAIRQMCVLARTEGGATAATARHILAHLSGIANDTDPFFRAMKRSACIGYIAAALAKPGANDPAEAEAAAVILLSKANLKADKPKPAGKRTAIEETIYGSANTAWNRAVEMARTMDPTAILPPKKVAKARKPTAPAAPPPVSTAAPTVTAGATPKAKDKATISLTPTLAVPAEAMAWLHAEAARIKAFAEANAKSLGAENKKAALAAASALLRLSRKT